MALACPMPDCHICLEGSWISIVQIILVAVPPGESQVQPRPSGRHHQHSQSHVDQPMDAMSAFRVRSCWSLRYWDRWYRILGSALPWRHLLVAIAHDLVWPLCRDDVLGLLGGETLPPYSPVWYTRGVVVIIC